MFQDFERQILGSGILLQNGLLSTHISTADTCAVTIHLSLPQRLNYYFATYMPTLLDNQKVNRRRARPTARVREMSPDSCRPTGTTTSRRRDGRYDVEAHCKWAGSPPDLDWVIDAGRGGSGLRYSSDSVKFS